MFAIKAVWFATGVAAGAFLVTLLLFSVSDRRCRVED